MNRTPICEEMVKMFEGLRLSPYRDAVGVWTIGYGHTGSDVPRPYPGELGPDLTPLMAETLLKKDLDEKEAEIVRMLPGFAPHPWEWDALVSFAFNVGAHALEQSTLLRLFKLADRRGAAAEFSRWRFAGGKVLPGLVKRRRAEAVRFLGGDFPLVASCYHGGVE